MRAKRLTPFAVRRSPQFIASFSKTTLGRVPTRRGSSGLRTLKTRTLSTPLVTNSGALFMKQPEMPAVPGWDGSPGTWATCSMRSLSTGAAPARSRRTRDARRGRRRRAPAPA